MFRIISFIGMTAGVVFLLAMITLYGFYFASMMTELSAPREATYTLEELIPLILAAILFLSLPMAFLFAFLIRKISKTKGIKHNLTRLMRVFFFAFIGSFVAAFFISSVYIEQYLHTISDHHGYLVCIRNKDDMNLEKDVLILPESAEACAEFQANG